MVLHLADYEKVYIKSNQNFETVFCFYAFIICRRSEKSMFTPWGSDFASQNKEDCYEETGNYY